MMNTLTRRANFSIVMALIIVGCPTLVSAEPLTSPSYRFEESSLGNGGLLQSNSANYQSSISVGDTAVDNSSSSNYQIESGSKTTDDPALSFSVDTASVEFNDFSTTTASVATSTFSVTNYTSYGYIVQVVGDPPNNGSHTITPMTTTGPSQVGTEQFGINLVANTSPTSVGANPDHGDFGVGSPTANYGTSNEYRYVSGEAIASAPKSSGKTTYTISYIVNVDSLTPGGDYTSNHVLICTGTY